MAFSSDGLIEGPIPNTTTFVPELPVVKLFSKLASVYNVVNILVIVIIIIIIVTVVRVTSHFNGSCQNENSTPISP